MKFNGWLFPLRMIYHLPMYRSNLELWFTFLTKGVHSIKVSGIKHPIKVRGRTSDIGSFEQVFLDKEYDMDLGNPKLIVDGGANVGHSAIWLTNKYPKAKIISIEPEPSNLILLKENVKPYKNIIIKEAALWHEKTKLKLKDPGHGKWGMMVEKGSSVQGITISSLGKIDVLKLDVEGAERELFQHPDWLDNINIIIVEIHDWHPGAREAFENAIKGKFNREEKGENIILRRV